MPPRPYILNELTWKTVRDARAVCSGRGARGGGRASSGMLHVARELARPLSAAGRGRARRLTITARREGWAWGPRRWRQVTEDAGVGDPAAATAEKGRKYV